MGHFDWWQRGLEGNKRICRELEALIVLILAIHWRSFFGLIIVISFNVSLQLQLV